MRLTRDFTELAERHIAGDPDFASAILCEALAGDFETGKSLLRSYVEATIGFEKLGEATGNQPKSLIRMFGPRETRRREISISVLGYLQRQAGVQLHVTAQPSQPIEGV
jgi:hypothetical protein